MSHLLKSAMLGAALLSAAFIQPALAAGIEVSDAWARARVTGAQAGAVYVTITNHGSTPALLVGASSPSAASSELHTHLMDGDVTKMRHVESIPLPAGEAVTFAPGGLHIMMIGLKETLTEGKVFPLTLTFKHAPPVTVEVTVGGMAAMGSHGTKKNQGHNHHGSMKK